jgi:hypothetical protein
MTSASAIITNDLFPFVYNMESPGPIDPIIQVYPDVYKYYGLPHGVQPWVDPAHISGPQKYEYRYTNQSGIDVVLRGAYESVMGVVDVLNTYPPKCLGNYNDKANESAMIDIFGRDPDDPDDPGDRYPSTVPKVGVKINANNSINIIMNNGKTYSGSGSIILVIQKNDIRSIATRTKIVLFKNQKKQKYEEPGGMIDKSFEKTADENTLFENAKKETREETRDLIIITKPSKQYIEIESIGNTWYRVYVYMMVVDDIDDIGDKYNFNRQKIDENFTTSRYSHDFKETSNLEFFDFKTFVTRLNNNYGTVPSFNTDGKFTPIEGGLPLTVSGRAMRIIGKGNVDNIFDLNKIERITPIITNNAATGLHNITL